MPFNQHKTVAVNEGIHQVWELTITHGDLHMKRVLVGSDLYVKIDKPEKRT